MTTAVLAPATPIPSDAVIEERVTSNMALVGHIVRESMGRLPGHVSRDDLTSAGFTALVQAARSYDESRLTCPGSRPIDSRTMWPTSAMWLRTRSSITVSEGSGVRTAVVMPLTLVEQFARCR